MSKWMDKLKPEQKEVHGLVGLWKVDCALGRGPISPMNLRKFTRI